MAARQEENSVSLTNYGLLVSDLTAPHVAAYRWGDVAEDPQPKI